MKTSPSDTLPAKHHFLRLSQIMQSYSIHPKHYNTVRAWLSRNKHTPGLRMHGHENRRHCVRYNSYLFANIYPHPHHFGTAHPPIYAVPPKFYSVRGLFIVLTLAAITFIVCSLLAIYA